MSSQTDRLRQRLIIPRAIYEVAMRPTADTPWVGLDLAIEMRDNPMSFSLSMRRLSDGSLEMQPLHNSYSNWHSSTCVAEFQDGNSCPIEAPVRGHIVGVYAMDHFRREPVGGNICRSVMEGLNIRIEGRSQTLAPAGELGWTCDPECACTFELQETSDEASPASL